MRVSSVITEAKIYVGNINVAHQSVLWSMHCTLPVLEGCATKINEQRHNSAVVGEKSSLRHVKIIWIWTIRRTLCLINKLISFEGTQRFMQWKTCRPVVMLMRIWTDAEGSETFVGNNFMLLTDIRRRNLEISTLKSYTTEMSCFLWYFLWYSSSRKSINLN